MTEKESEPTGTPEPTTPTQSVREQLRELGVTDSDIADAVAWSRRGAQPKE